MRHPKLLSTDNCLLLVVDVQEAFRPHIPQFDALVERCRVVIESAKLLHLPIIVTEQYPRGLGRTVETLRPALDNSQFFEKVSFSCCADDAIRQSLLDRRRSQILLVGIETHVCIAQTSYDLTAMALQPYVAADAVGSRRQSDARTALDRLRDAGVVVTTTEAAILEMAVSSRHPAFKEITQLIK